ncbi:NAD-dependent epimerase/dehydratase family protein [Streptomyces peucetius]|uniref:NAD-dependent epimerase/dehydratase family protein n=1 Tax=Streptomyces peucetius TaxID=1950 RepID=A0ABY6I8T0_STRPE|nr:NAD-dependent epimerase/dehydratase family protein [Streptomyces peucetius]UYQ62640.1 NAD-dependent epimerase/dehydratase family protein [Streptomyces peucetius]
MNRTRVVVTGGTGFVGRAVLRDLLRDGASGRGVSVRAAVRTVRPGTEDVPDLERVTAELTDPRSVRGLLDGADVLVHLASRVVGSEEECTAVNVDGTRAVMAEARRHSVGRIVHLSTAAVYGAGPHRGIPVDGVTPDPVSPASRTRLAGERVALDAGAVVLRPGLVLGAGDQWVVPALAEFLQRVPAAWDGGRGQASLVDVGDLARLIGTLARSPDPLPHGVHHASHPRPVRNRDLLACLAELDVLPAGSGDLPWAECLRRLRRTPGRLSERQFTLVAGDHWYLSEEIWRLTGCPEGPGPLARLADAAPWYRAHLAGRPGARPRTVPHGEQDAKAVPDMGRPDACRSGRG